MKFSNQLLLAKVINTSFHLTGGRPDRIYISSLICLLGIGMPSPPALSQPIDTFPTARSLNAQTPIAIAEATGSVSDNFNPGLQLPPPTTEPLPPPPEKPQAKPVSPGPELSLPKPSLAKGPISILESVAPDFKNTLNDSGQIDRTIEATATFVLENGDRIKLRSGYNTFIKPGFPTINNTPLEMSWQTKIDRVKIEPSIGVDLFDRLTATPRFGLKASIPVTPNFTLSGAAEYSTYKFNTETIQNQVTALRFGPSLLWQIDKNTSWVTNYKYGIYNDNNTENQLFSRLEHKSGQFWIAANLFSWGYAQNIGAAKGYFSPPDFLAYSGEIGMEGNILFDSLSCKLSTQLGSQTSSGASTIGQSYQVLCKTKLSPNLEANFGYGFGNSRKDFSAEETGNTRTITGGLNYKF